MGAKGPTASGAVGTQTGLQSSAIGQGNSAVNPALSYYNSILQGGPAAQQAVAPSAQAISQATVDADAANLKSARAAS